MTKIDNVTDLRKRLLTNGYVPLAAIDKRCFLKDWNTLKVNEAMIDGWSRMKRYQSTALRLDKLITPDVDVPIPAVKDDVVRAFEDALPDHFAYEDVPLLERGTTASCKVTYYFRSDPDEVETSAIRTAAYTRPEDADVEGAPTCRVEIFMGADRFSGSVGAHAEGKSDYTWPVDSPRDVPIDQLPVLTRKQAGQLCIAATAVFERHGLVKIEGTDNGADHEGTWQYTIEDDAVFVCADGVERTLDEMREAAACDEGVRCSASWLEGPKAVNTTRCLARTLGAKFFVTAFDSGIKHMPISDRPEPMVDLNDYLPAMKARGGAKPPEGDGNAGAMALWLRENYAYCKTAKSPVVPIHATAIDEGATTEAKLRSALMRYDDIGPTPRGGTRPKRTSAVTLWLASPGVIEVEGYAFRPDRPRPLYEEDGKRWINIYHPPVHDAVGGSAATLIQFVTEQIAAVPEERPYFIKLFAHKFRNPAVPGPGVIMVAHDNFGTGRGAFEKLLGKLFGLAYVRNVPFRIFMGENYQSQYNTYEEGSLIIVVDEAQQIQRGGKYAAQVDNSAVLRERVSPEAKMKQITMKGGNNRSVMVYAKGIVMTNSFDIFRMLERERRLFVLTNGEQQPPAYWTRVHASIDNPADVAALAAWLMSIDLSDFDPYAPPPMTDGKRTMIEDSKSELDLAIDAALDSLGGKSEIYAASQVVNAIAALAPTDTLHPGWAATAKRVLGQRGSGYRVTEHGGHLMFKGMRTPVYAWEKDVVSRWKRADRASILRELLKAGPIDGRHGMALPDTFGSDYISGDADGEADVGGDVSDNSLKSKPN